MAWWTMSPPAPNRSTYSRGLTVRSRGRGTSSCPTLSSRVRRSNHAATRSMAASDILLHLPVRQVHHLHPTQKSILNFLTVRAHLDDGTGQPGLFGGERHQMALYGFPRRGEQRPFASTESFHEGLHDPHVASTVAP